jgi:hypothetical protein
VSADELRLEARKRMTDRELAAYRQAVGLLIGCNFIEANDVAEHTAAGPLIQMLTATMTRHINEATAFRDSLEENGIEISVDGEQ